MKIEKLQKELLNIILKNEFHNKHVQILVEELYNDLIAIAIAGSTIYIIPQYCFYIDVSSCDKMTVASRIATNKRYDEPFAYLTEHIRVLESKITIQKISDGTRETWVDVSLLKFFDEPRFYFEKPNGLITVYEDDIIVGYVMPVMYKGV